MMRILFISNLFPPNQIGGYEVLCARVAKIFAKKGHEVHVLTSCYGGKVSIDEAVTISQGLRLLCGGTIYQGFSKGDGRQNVIYHDNIAVTKSIVKNIHPDVIFVWNLYGLHHAYFRALTNLGVAVVCMLTDNWLAEMLAPEFIKKYFDGYVYGDQRDDKLVPPVNMQLVNVSAVFGAQYMQNLYEAAGLDFLNATVIHNGVNLTPQLVRKRKSRLNLINGKEGPVRLLFAGRLVRLKGAHTVVEALGKLNSQYSGLSSFSFSLTIVGDATEVEYLAFLKSLIVHWELTDVVRFMPPCPEKELSDLFDEHDIYLFPSLYEPFSLTLIHAMASGIPIVASEVGGNGEIVTNGKTGMMFPVGDANSLANAIEILATNGELRERLSSLGRAEAAQFTVARMVDRMEKYLIQQAVR